jgi:transposase InsO family protein
MPGFSEILFLKVSHKYSNPWPPNFPEILSPRPVFRRIWVADITYIAIAVGFVYMAAILDAWSRRVVASAISRSMDARLADGTDSSERHKHGAVSGE